VYSQNFCPKLGYFCQLST